MPTPLPVSAAVGAFMASANSAAALASINGFPDSVLPSSAFVFEGDSLTSPNSGDDWPAQLMALPLFAGKGTAYNVATVSDTLAGIITDYATEVYPQRPSANSGRPAWLFVWIGANDMGSVVTADYLDDLQDYWQTATDDGFNVVAMTITPGNYSQAQEDQRQAVNAGIRLAAASVCVSLVDVAALFPNHLDTSVYVDGLHFQPEANLVIANEVQTVVATLRDSPMPDGTAATAIAGPLFVGSTLAVRTGYRMDVLSDFGGTDANGGLQVIGRWAPSGSSSNAVTALTAQVEKRGNQYGQDAIAIAANGYLQSSTVINSVSLIQTFGGNQATSYGGANGTYLYVFNHIYSRSPIADANNPIDISSAIRVESQKVTGVGTGYVIYSTGADDLSVLAGKLRVGSTSNPTYTLHVAGSIGGGTLNLSALPTSASGLSAGDVWNNLGILNIV